MIVQIYRCDICAVETDNPDKWRIGSSGVAGVGVFLFSTKLSGKHLCGPACTARFVERELEEMVAPPQLAVTA